MPIIILLITSSNCSMDFSNPKIFLYTICVIFFIRSFFSEKIDPMIKGEFIEEKEVMCYVACIMKMANAVI